MSNSNLVARLYPWPPHSEIAIETIRRSRFAVLPVTRSAIVTRFGRHDNLVTPVDDSASAGINQLQAPHLEISFDKPPQTSHGVIFGTNFGSDVLLPESGRLSAHHFSIGFDEQQRLVIRDLNSSYGTQVTFGALGKGFRRRFQWLVSCGDKLGPGPVIIKVNSELSFCLIPQRHDVTDFEYSRKVQYFCQGLGNTSQLFNSVNLKLYSASEPPQGANLFLQQPMYLEKPLKSGGWGLITYRCNVSTGDEAVVKRPIEEHEDDQADWSHEAHCMRILEHDNILKLLHAEFSPRIELHLEYCPEGSLSNILHELTTDEILSILQQSLAGLEHAHKLGVAHRDLKPDNILIACRWPLKIKLADFGIAKGSKALQTYCGTPNFMAPEILNLAHPIPGKVTTYTEAVDIWALGIVIHELLFGRDFVKDTVDLCTEVVERLQIYLQSTPGTIAEFLAKHMLRVKVEERSPAAVCYYSAMALPPPNDQIQRPVRSRQTCFDFLSTENDTISFPNCSRLFDETSTLDEDASIISDLSSLYWLLETNKSQSLKRPARESDSDEIDLPPRKRQLTSTPCQARASGWGGSRRKPAKINLPTLME
ncbi:hypothetical protein PWT90_09331 [Aphanocladium album]|nr:hypothetical protein PWT90_09331 [Aphanocladium album]